MLMRTLDAFIDHLRSLRVSPLTIRNYRHYLARFAHFAGDCDVRTINETLVARYREHLTSLKDARTAKFIKTSTLNYHLIALRSFLRYCAHVRAISFDFRSIDLVKHHYKRAHALSKEHLHALLTRPDLSTRTGLRDQAILELLASTGILVSSLTMLNRSDYHAKQRTLRTTTKHAQAKDILLPTHAAGVLAQYLLKRTDPFVPLFIRYQGLLDLTDDGEYMRLTPRSVERIVAKYARKLMLPFPVTPHTLRHSYARTLLDEGKSKEEVRDALSHMHASSVQLLYLQ